VIPKLPELNLGFASCYLKFPNKIRVLGIPSSGFGLRFFFFPALEHRHTASSSLPTLSCPVVLVQAHGPPRPRAPPRRRRESSGRAGVGRGADGSREVTASVVGGGARGRRRGRGRGLLNLPGCGARPRRWSLRRQATMRTRVPPRSDPPRRCWATFFRHPDLPVMAALVG
jgi:hypothetical protein